MFKALSASVLQHIHSLKSYRQQFLIMDSPACISIISTNSTLFFVHVETPMGRYPAGVCGCVVSRTGYNKRSASLRLEQEGFGSCYYYDIRIPPSGCPHRRGQNICQSNVDVLGRKYRRTNYLLATGHCSSPSGKTR